MAFCNFLYEFGEHPLFVIVCPIVFNVVCFDKGRSLLGLKIHHS